MPSGPYAELPRTAGFGYPEPYTRDLMISLPGFLLTGKPDLREQMRKTLEALARHQSPRGHIPSLAHDPENLGASDTTPLFLFGLAVFRRALGEPEFLESAAQKAIAWMRYQSPDDRVMVAQLPTTDWRDEHWVYGYGLYVNALVHAYLPLYGLHEEAAELKRAMNRRVHTDAPLPEPERVGLAIPDSPHYAAGAFKIFHDPRCDVLGNSLAILSKLADPERAERLIDYIELNCEALRARGRVSGPASALLFPVHAAGRPRLAAQIRDLQSAGRVSQRRGLAIRVRVLRCGLCIGRAPRARSTEARSLGRARQTLARGRMRLGLQRASARTNRQTHRSRLANLVGRHVSLRSRVRGDSDHALLWPMMHARLTRG